MMNIFLGHGLEYWLELEKQAMLTDKTKLIDQIVELRQRALIAEGLLRDIQSLLGTANARLR